MATAAPLLLVVAVPLAGFTASRQNAAADRVVELSRALGIDFDEKNEKAPHPAAADVAAYGRSGAGAWLNAQIENDSDEISEPPPGLRDFLHDRNDLLWSVIVALEKGSPEWDSGSVESAIRPLLPAIRLERVLLAAALVEERDRNRIDSGRALEAAWSLGRSISSGKLLIMQLVSLAAETMRVGAIRKLQAPPLQWLGRLSTDGPWLRMLDVLPREGRLRDPDPDDETRHASAEVAAKILVAVADAAKRLAPCDLAGMTDEEIFRPAAAALAAETNALKRAIRDLYTEAMVENVASSIRRSARLEIDRELTLKVLQLRLEKDASADGRWPKNVVDRTSAACPASGYVYRGGKDGMELRFEGSIDVPSKGPVLPLTFRSKSPPSTPTPAAPEASTPTPLTVPAEGGMMPPQ